MEEFGRENRVLLKWGGNTVHGISKVSEGPCLIKHKVGRWVQQVIMKINGLLAIIIQVQAYRHSLRYKLIVIHTEVQVQ